LSAETEGNYEEDLGSYYLHFVFFWKTVIPARHSITILTPFWSLDTYTSLRLKTMKQNWTWKWIHWTTLNCQSMYQEFTSSSVLANLTFALSFL
jgi:hypothetical protein